MKDMYLDDIEQVVSQGCTSPECNHEDHGKLYMHSGCHPDSDGVDVSYTLGDDCITVTCIVCHANIIRVVVAKRSVN